MSITHRGVAADVYESMLADRRRTLAFRDAIRAHVRDGHVVADLGCGSSILSLFAAEAGARHVIAVERNPQSAALARDIVRDNGYADVIEVVEADAATLDLGEQVDVVVSELIGNFGPEEMIEQVLGGFCQRHLRADGVAIPNRLETWLAPAAFDGELTGLWWQDSFGFDLSAGGFHVNQRAARYVTPCREWAELALPARIETLRFGPAGVEVSGDRSAEFAMTESARLEGFIGWFSSELCPGITLSNRRRTAETSWPLWFWPVAPGIEVAAGQHLSARVLDNASPANAMNWRLDWVTRDPSTGR